MKKKTAKKKAVKKAVKKATEKIQYYVSVFFDGDYYANRDKLEAAAGKRSGGSGMGFGGCDCAWYDLSLARAEAIVKRIKKKRFRFVREILIQNQDL